MLRGGLALPDFSGLFNIKMADDKRACIKCVKCTEAKHVHASFEEIFDDICSENLLKLSKERPQYCCDVLKLKQVPEKRKNWCRG